MFTVQPGACSTHRASLGSFLLKTRVWYQKVFKILNLSIIYKATKRTLVSLNTDLRITHQREVVSLLANSNNKRAVPSVILLATGSLPLVRQQFEGYNDLHP